MSLITIQLKGLETYFKSLFEYRPAFFTDMLSNIIAYSGTYFVFWVLMDKFKMIQGWTMWEVLLIFNMNMVSYALCSFFFRSAMYVDVEDMIRTGRFDIVLIRPMNPLLYTMLGRPAIAYFGHLILGIVVFWVCFSNLAVEWTFFKVLYFILTLAGAALIQSAMYIVNGTLGFWIVRTNTVFGTFMHDFRNFITYPMSIYTKFMQVILTFVLPFGFINFYPAHYLLDKDTGNLFHPILQYGTPVVGILMFLGAYLFWTCGVNKYESTGS